jgi:predicted transcriptional regulator
LALAVVGGGAFAKYATHARLPELPVSLEDAARATSAQVHEIVRYIEQSDPQLFNNLLELLARDTATIAALGASIAALTMHTLVNRRETRHVVTKPQVSAD